MVKCCDQNKVKFTVDGEVTIVKDGTDLGLEIEMHVDGVSPELSTKLSKAIGRVFYEDVKEYLNREASREVAMKNWPMVKG